MHIVLLKCSHIQIAFLKFTSCDNQALVGCSNSCCSCSFKPEIIKIGQSSQKMYSNNILNFQEFTTILKTCKKKSLETYWMHYLYIYIYIFTHTCTYIHIHIYIHIYIHVHVYIYIYIYTHMYIYIHVQHETWGHRHYHVIRI